MALTKKRFNAKVSTTQRVLFNSVLHLSVLVLLKISGINDVSKGCRRRFSADLNCWPPNALTMEPNYRSKSCMSTIAVHKPHKLKFT